MPLDNYQTDISLTILFNWYYISKFTLEARSLINYTHFIIKIIFYYFFVHNFVTKYLQTKIWEVNQLHTTYLNKFMSGIPSSSTSTNEPVANMFDYTYQRSIYEFIYLDKWGVQNQIQIKAQLSNSDKLKKKSFHTNIDSFLSVSFLSVFCICIFFNVGEPRFGTSGPLLLGPARPEWYHGLTENRRETTLALCFAEWVRLPEAQTP